MVILRFIIAIIFSILFFNTSYAACTAAIDGASSTQYNCDNSDLFTVTSTGTVTVAGDNALRAEDTDGVTVVNSGTIQNLNNGTGYQAAINGSATRNLTITNNGTLQSTEKYTIHLENAEQVTITNNAGATIGTVYTVPIGGSADTEQGAIYGNNIGNCDDGDCYNSSDSNGGAGLTLHNYGTISSRLRTIAGGLNSNDDKSRNIKIYNYDGGSITAETSATLKFRFVEDFALYNYSGATLESGTVDASAANFVVDVESGNGVVIDNDGTIKSGKMYAINCDECVNFTLDNSGVIEATGDTVFARNLTGTNSITNSGTIKNTSGGRALQIKESSGLTLTNTGTIESVTQVAVDLIGSVNPTIINRGTIKSTANKAKVVDLAQNSDEDGTGGTLENYGTIINSTGSSGQSIRVGDGDGPWNNLSIINSGTISSVGETVLVSGGSETTGLNITTKGEGTWVGEIDMEDAAVTMTLDCSISKDQDIEIEDKTNMVVVNNLCGNDTYEILDSSKNTDADNSETNGYIRIYGEDLDIDSHNKKYRTEIFLARLNNIFTSTYENKEQSTYYSRQKRDDIYKNHENGVLGFFKKNRIESKGGSGGGLEHHNFLEKPFISYSDQRASFNNSEYLGSENLAFGFRKKIQTEKFNLSIVPVVGISQNKVVDVETETNQWIKKGFSSQFAGVNSSMSKKIDYDNKSNLTLEINGIYGLHRLPNYLTNFTDGDLSVDDAIDQVLGAGFNVKYSKENNNGFVLEPYVGLSMNTTLSNDVGIIADGENKEAGHVMNGVLAKKIGFDLAKNTENLNFAIKINYQDQDGLIENSASISLSKKIQQISKFRKEREREIPELEKLFDQLQLAKENERLAELAGKTVEENKVMKELIIQLLKENQKLKTENKLFTN